MHRLIPPTKNDAREPIKLLEPHRRRRVERHEAHDGRLDVRRRTEVVPAYAHHQVDFRVELHVRGEARPERGAGLRDEAQRELALEHQDCGAEERAVREEAEDERGGDLVGRVGDADVEVGQLCFHKVADDDLESTLLGPLKKRKGVFFLHSVEGVRGWVGDVLALDALCELCGHAGVHLHRCAVLCLVQYEHRQVSRTWADFEDLIRRAEVGLDCQSKSPHRNTDRETKQTFSTILWVQHLSVYIHRQEE